MAGTRVVAVSRTDVEAYQRDGAVMLKGVLDAPWIAALEAGVACNIGRPSRRRADWVKDDAGGNHLFVDAIALPENPHLERCMVGSPLGAIAAQMMGQPSVLAFYATVFVRSAGTRSRTPWHQDQPYWPASGHDALSIWTCLDPVPAGTELAFVRGSHLWPRPLAKPYFAQDNLGGEMDLGDAETMAVPDFDGVDRDRFDFLRWPMEPGDVLVFHAMTVHGGSGDLPAGLRRRSISTQWLGEDARITDRAGGCNPDLLPDFAAYGLFPGDRPDSPMCPRVNPAEMVPA